MSIALESTPDFFEAKYRRDPDPWNFAGSAYELGRYGAILAALSHRRYGRAFEPGSSIGVLTAELSILCDAVEAIDFSPTAAERARQRCAHLPNVQVGSSSLAERMPVAGFDLIVLSEIGYYFEPNEWNGLCAQLIAGISIGGTLLAAHWLGSSPDHRMSGDHVHEILCSQASLRREWSERRQAFRLDRWTRV